MKILKIRLNQKRERNTVQTLNWENRKKKAIQFGSGVTKALRQIARKNGFNNARDYLFEKYEKIKEYD